MTPSLAKLLAGRQSVAFGAGEYFGRYCERSAEAFAYFVDDALAGGNLSGRAILPVSALRADVDKVVVFLFCRDYGSALLQLASLGFTWGKNVFDARWFGDGTHVGESYQVYASWEELAASSKAEVHLAAGAHWKSGRIVLRTLPSGPPAGVFLAEGAMLITGDLLISSGTRLSVGRSGLVDLAGGVELPGEFSLNGSLGSRVTVGAGVIFSPHSVVNTASYTRIDIGDGATFGPHLDLYAYAPVSIGAGVMVSSYVFVASGSGHDLVVQGEARPPRPVLLGERVWVGWGARLLGGAELGEGCMVAASSMVNRCFPTRTLVGGVPAKALQGGIRWDRDYRAYKKLFYPRKQER